MWIKITVRKLFQWEVQQHIPTNNLIKNKEKAIRLHTIFSKDERIRIQKDYNQFSWSWFYFLLSVKNPEEITATVKKTSLYQKTTKTGEEPVLTSSKKPLTCCFSGFLKKCVELLTRIKSTDTAKNILIALSGGLLTHKRAINAQLRNTSLFPCFQNLLYSVMYLNHSDAPKWTWIPNLASNC